MRFEQRLQRTVGHAATEMRHERDDRERAISARHDDRHGYDEVEYDAPHLHIRFGLIDGAAHLHWRTAFDVQDSVIAAETGRAEIDAALLDAVSSFVGTRTQATPDGVDRP